MKKLILSFGLSTLLLTSCSPGDSSSSANAVLVRQTYQTFAGSSSTSTTTYTYNGRKMLRADYAGGGYQTYTYSGDLLTQIKYYDNTNTLVALQTFIYNSENKLIQYLNVGYSSNQGYRQDHVYNADGTISVTEYTGNSVSQTHESKHFKIYFSGEDISTIEFYQDGAVSSTNTFTTDIKNNPFKNVTGFDAFGLVNALSSQGISHNIVAHAWDQGAGAHQYTNTYTYNSFNYPLTSMGMLDGDTSTSTTMYYTYY